MADPASAVRRHIQDEAAAEWEIPHWGYPSRMMPCTNDPGSCEYLDGVYWMHDVSMLYTCVLWPHSMPHLGALSIGFQLI
jgi:hypothetical protein